MFSGSGTIDPKPQLFWQEGSYCCSNNTPVCKCGLYRHKLSRSYFDLWLILISWGTVLGSLSIPIKTKDNKLLDTQTCRNLQTWRVCCSWSLHVKSKLRIKFAYLVFIIFDKKNPWTSGLGHSLILHWLQYIAVHGYNLFHLWTRSKGLAHSQFPTRLLSVSGSDF